MEQGARSGTFLHEAPQPGPEHARLEVFIGKWINEGETVATAEADTARIVTSDVYEWIPGGFAVLHTAYGRIGDLDVGGVEILGYDASSGKYTSHFALARPRSSAMTESSSAPSTSNQRMAWSGDRPWT